VKRPNGTQGHPEVKEGTGKMMRGKDEIVSVRTPPVAAQGRPNNEKEGARAGSGVADEKRGDHYLMKGSVRHHKVKRGGTERDRERMSNYKFGSEGEEWIKADEGNRRGCCRKASKPCSTMKKKAKGVKKGREKPAPEPLLRLVCQKTSI